MTSLLNSQTTNEHAEITASPSSAPNSRTGQATPAAHPDAAGSGTNFPHAYGRDVAQASPGVGDTNLPETRDRPSSIWNPSPASNLLPSQRLDGSHVDLAGQDTNSQTTTGESISKRSASSVPYLPGASDASHTREVSLPASDSPHGHSRVDTQRTNAVGGHNPAGDHRGCESQSNTVSGAQRPTPDQRRDDNHGPIVRGGWLRDPVLGLLADVLDDLEKVRIANENRVRQLTRTEEDSDGEERGFGLTLDNPMVRKLVTSVEALAQAEKDATANLQKAMKAHPLGPWVKSQAGVGEKQAARLLATIGDPFWNDLHDRPRTVSELWSFCGYAVHDGHAQARRRGERSNWSADAKMRTYLIAVSCVKQSAEKSKYRRVYDEGRAKYADAVHPHDCKRCGPAGKPALAGSPLSAGHQHNRAIRLISKELLKDLWIASRDLYLAKEAS